MSISIRAVVAQVSRYISDQEKNFEFLHWEERDLLHYAALAMDIIASHNKRHFSHRTKVTLHPGAWQRVPLPCEDVIERIVTDVDGYTIPLLADMPVAYNYPKACKEVIPYRIRGVYISPDTNTTLAVEPPVPEGQTYDIWVTCYVPPKVTSLDDILDSPSGMDSVMFELMLYYAWGVDIEAVPSRERSMYHWKNAMDILTMGKPSN